MAEEAKTSWFDNISLKWEKDMLGRYYLALQNSIAILSVPLPHRSWVALGL